MWKESPFVTDASTPKTALYARVSTTDQKGASQIARLNQWAKNEGRKVAIRKIDNATGKNIRRPGIDLIMQEARGHHINTIAVTKVDRWARSVRDLSNTLHELQDLGVEWVAIDQGLRISPDRSDPTTKLILEVLGAVAEWEASIISERTRQALAYLKAKGKRLGRPPGSKDRSPRSKKGYLERYAGRHPKMQGGTP